MCRCLRDLHFVVWMMAYWVGSASAGDAVKVGDRVRIHAPALTGALDPAVLQEEKLSPFISRQVLIGTVTELGRDTLNLQVRDEDVSVPVDAVERMDVWSRGHYGAPFAFVGAVGGAVIGGLIGKSMEKEGPCPPGQLLCDLEFKTIQGVAIGVLLGGVLGHVIGTTVPRNNWKEVNARSFRPNVILGQTGNVSLVCHLRF